MATTTYYGDKIRYNNTLVQAGGASTYPIVSLGTRLGDNGFKVSNSTGFIRKVVTDTVVSGGYTTVWYNAPNSSRYFWNVYGVAANNYYNYSYKITINAKATSGSPYLMVCFDGYYDSCYYVNDWQSTSVFSTTPTTKTLTNNYSNQGRSWDLYFYCYGGTLAIYYLNMIVYSNYNQSGTAATVCSYGSPYVAPTNQTITNTYYV